MPKQRRASRRQGSAGGTNSVRIIGGKYRGRKLEFPSREGLRPSLGRVRETLFNWLAPMLPDSRCLDLFAGTGALGIEALSRGAASVQFVEQDAAAARAIQQALTQFGAPADAWSLNCMDAARFRSEHRFDVLFLDPPFGAANLRRWLEGSSGWLKAESLVYFELPAAAPLAETCLLADQARPEEVRFTLHRHRRAGDLQFGLLKPAPPHLASLASEPRAR